MKYQKMFGEVDSHMTGSVHEMNGGILREGFEERWDLPSAPIDAPEMIVCGCIYRVEWASDNSGEVMHWFPAQKITLRSLMS